MAAPPPVIKIGPPPAKGPKGNSWQQFVNYWGKQYPQFKQNADAILAAAKAEHIDPVTFGALVLNESGGDFNTKDSKTGAVGIGQLEPGTFIGPNAFNGGVLPWDPTHTVTLADLRNPGTNVRLAAAYAGYLQGAHPADWYGRYNAGPNASDAQAGGIQAAFVRKWVTKWDPKYVAPSVETAPPAAAGQQVPGGTAPSAPDIRNPYVTVRGGKLVNVSDPNKALQYFGAPVTRSLYKQLYVDLSQHYLAYTGRMPTTAQAMSNLFTHPISTYALKLQLANSPAFQNSPIYKQTAANYISVWHNIYGPQSTPDKKAIVAAAAKGLDQSAFAEQLRERPDYTKSEEYKQNFAQMSSAYQKIYGVPDDGANNTIAAATKQGWSPDQFATWLRKQPAYNGSEEYKAKAISFAQQMGLITGQMPTLTFQQAELGGAPAAPVPPPSPNQNNQQPSLPVAQPPQGEPKNQPPFTRKVA